MPERDPVVYQARGHVPGLDEDCLPGAHATGVDPADDLGPECFVHGSVPRDP